MQSTAPRGAVQSTVPRKTGQKHSTPEGQYRPSPVPKQGSAEHSAPEQSTALEGQCRVQCPGGVVQSTVPWRGSA